MSPTAKTTLKVVYKMSVVRLQMSDQCLRSERSSLISVLSDKNFHKELTLLHFLVRLIRL